MKLIIALTFMMVFFVFNTFAQKGGVPEPVDTRIALKGEVSPSAFPFSQALIPSTAMFSFSNNNSNSAAQIQSGDAFVLSLADPFFIFLNQNANSLIVNSSALSARDFQLVQGQGKLTIIYIGRSTLFPPGDTISLRVSVLSLATGAGNFTFEVFRKGAELSYAPVKQFVRISAVDFPIGAPPTPRTFTFSLNQTDPVCLSGDSIPIIQGLQSFVSVPNSGTLLGFAKIQLMLPDGGIGIVNVKVLVFVDGVEVSSNELQRVPLSNNQFVVLRGDVFAPISAGSHVIQLTVQANAGCFSQGQFVGVVFP